VISWSARRYGNTAVNKNICHIYVIWFQRQLKWLQFKTEVKDQSFGKDAYLNALRKFGLNWIVQINFGFKPKFQFETEF